MHSELSITTLYLISNLQTPLRYSWYSSAAAETFLLLRVTAVVAKLLPTEARLRDGRPKFCNAKAKPKKTRSKVAWRSSEVPQRQSKTKKSFQRKVARKTQSSAKRLQSCEAKSSAKKVVSSPVEEERKGKEEELQGSFVNCLRWSAVKNQPAL